MSTILQSFSFWSKLERWKRPKVGASWADHKSKKLLLWSVFSYSTQQWTISLSDCDVWWKVNQWQPAQWLNWEEALRNFPKPNFHQKKGHGHCLVVWSAAHRIHYSFLNPGETITSEKYAQQIDAMHWKLQHLQLTLINRTGPVLLHDTAQPHVAQPMLQKLNKLGYTVLLHPLYSPDLSSTNYNLFKHLNNFLQGKCFYNQQGTENAFRNFMKHEFLCYRNKQTYVSLTKMCWL